MVCTGRQAAWLNQKRKAVSELEGSKLHPCIRATKLFLPIRAAIGAIKISKSVCTPMVSHQASPPEVGRTVWWKPRNEQEGGSMPASEGEHPPSFQQELNQRQVNGMTQPVSPAWQQWTWHPHTSSLLICALGMPFCRVAPQQRQHTHRSFSAAPRHAPALVPHQVPTLNHIATLPSKPKEPQRLPGRPASETPARVQHIDCVEFVPSPLPPGSPRQILQSMASSWVPLHPCSAPFLYP